MQQKFETWRVFSLDFQNTQKTHNQPLTIFFSSLEEGQQSMCWAKWNKDKMFFEYLNCERLKQKSNLKYYQSIH
jgi:hypothetical protein